MKKPLLKTLTTLSALLFAVALFSQDIIKPKKGEEIKAKIVNVTETEVEYKLFYFQEGASFKLSTKDIASIRYTDGKFQTFDTPAPEENNPYSGATTIPASSVNTGELTKGLNKLSTQIAELNTGQNGQTKALTETLTALNTNIVSLKTTIEQGNTTAKEQHDQTVAKLNALNTSVAELNETTRAKASSETHTITPRKFGMGVSFITNFMLANFTDPNGDDITTPDEESYKGLYLGAGFNLIISTRMDKKVGFRYEPEFSVASRFYSEKTSSGTTTTRASLFSFGSRFLGVARRNRVNIYAGPSLTIFGVVRSLKVGSVTATTAQVGAGFGLHFGGEYLVHSNFGINLESGMQLYGLFPKDGNAEGLFSTYARLGGRFYF